MAAVDLGALVVRVKADMREFISGLNKAQEKIRVFSARLQGSMRANAAAMRRLGRQLTLRVTLPIVGLAAASVKAGVDIEEAFIGVRKTVDATEEEFAKLRAGFDEMALRTPIAITELIALGEAAGQLGIETKNIIGFSETMAQLGVTTNLSSQEAATALARLANITQMPQENFDRLGATIVELGNNLATTEAEIVNLGLRLAGAGQAIGLTEDQILSFGAAMSSLGIRAESGGSAFSRVMLEMNTAVLSGTKELQTFARVAGKTASDFARLFKKEPAEALALFVDGLQKIKETGGDVAGVLSELGLSNIRIIDVFNRLSGSGDLLRKSLKLGSEAWKENTALVDEARKKYESTLSQFKILLNTVKLVGEEFFVVMKPAIDAMTESLKDFLKWVKNLTPEMKKLVVIVGGLAAVVGPALILVGSLAGIMGTVGLAAVGTAASILTVVAALVALKNAPQIGEFLLDQFKTVDQHASSFLLTIMEGWAFIEFGFKQMVTAITFAWGKMLNNMKQSIALLLDVISLLPFNEVFSKIAKGVRDSITTISKEGFAENKRNLEEQLESLSKLSDSVFSEIELKFREKEKAKAEAVKEVEDAIQKLIDNLTPKIESATKKWQGWFNDWTGGAIDTFNNMSQIASDAMDGLSDDLTDLVLTGKASFSELANSILRDITRMIIKAQLARIVMDFLPGITPIAPGTTTPVTLEGTAVPGFAKGGIVNPVFAARGFVARGTDTVPAMLTPGEAVLPKKLTDSLMRQDDQGGGGVNLTIQAIDTQTGIQFLLKHKNVIASALQSASQDNHPFRRGQG